ncbi:hypothetical protein BDK51DRAFT_24805, partial [Blyttiomyces helicus]
MQYVYCRIRYGDSLREYRDRVVIVSESLGGYWTVIKNVCSLSLLFNAGAYCWYLSVSRIPMGDLTAIYNSSCFFTYIFSVLVLREALSAKKLLAVLMSVGGIAVISLLSHPNDVDPLTDSSPASTLFGYFSALLSALWVASYEVAFTKHLVPPTRPSPLFSLHVTGLVGVASAILGTIPFPLLHLTQWEPFELPPAQALAGIAVTAALGLAFNAVFMLLISFGGPVVAAVGVMLTIPLTVGVDFFVTGSPIRWAAVVGTVLILAGFGMLTWEQAEERRR